MSPHSLSRHRGYLLLGILFATFQFWHALRFGLGRAFPSFQGVPVSRDTLLLLAALFLISLLCVPFLLLVAKCTKSWMFRVFALMALGKAYPSALVMLAFAVSLSDLPQRDRTELHCLRRPDPSRCESARINRFAERRFFNREQAQEIERVAKRAKEFDRLPGSRQEKARKVYAALEEAYHGERFEEAVDLGFRMVRLAPDYRDSKFFLGSAQLELFLLRQRARAEEIARWKRTPGRGVASLAASASKLLASKKTERDRVELLTLAEEIFRRDPGNATGRKVLRELGLLKSKR